MSFHRNVRYSRLDAKRLEFPGKIIIFVNGAGACAPPQWLTA
jgi:hypothetical protein